MSIILLVVIILICIFLEGFFSGSELALVVADKLRLENRANMGDKNAGRTRDLVKRPSWLFSTTLLGTNLCVVAASTVLTYFIIREFGDEYSALALLLSPVVLIFGEIVPKSVYQHHADGWAPRVGSLLWWVSIVMLPFVWLLSKLTELLLGGVTRVGGPRLARDELALILSSKEVQDSDMPATERRMIRKVFEFSDDEVENIMVPLVEVDMLPVTADTEAALAAFDLKGKSRLPVFEHRAYNIVGMIDSTDCIFATKNLPLKEIMKPVIYVPENMPLYELYESLQDAKEEFAVVVDEYGGATGLVSLEDLLEEVVGEIRDEYELEEQHFRRLGEGHYLVSGRMEIERANEELGLAIPEGDYETVAGFILDMFGYIPEVGEEIRSGNWLYVVKNASPKAVHEVEVLCQ